MPVEDLRRRVPVDDRLAVDHHDCDRKRRQHRSEHRRSAHVSAHRRSAHVSAHVSARPASRRQHGRGRGPGPPDAGGAAPVSPPAPVTGLGLLPEIQTDEHTLGIREIADDLANRWRQPAFQGGNGHDLLTLSELRPFQQVDHLDGVPPRQVLLADVLRNWSAPRSNGASPPQRRAGGAICHRQPHPRRRSSRPHRYSRFWLEEPDPGRGHLESPDLVGMAHPSSLEHVQDPLPLVAILFVAKLHPAVDE